MPEEQKKTSNTAFVIIAISLFILVVETGILISKLNKPAGSPANKADAEKISAPSVPQSSAQQQQPVQPPIMVAYDPFSSTPMLRRTRRARTQASAPAQGYSQDMDDPFAAMEKIQERMNHLFDTAFLNSQIMAQNLMNNPKNSLQTFDLEPPVDLQDDGNNYIIKSDMPGLEKDKISIDIQGTNLSITGTRENVSEKKDESTGFVSQERSYGSFSKSLTLPGPVDETKVFADYKNGVLTIRLPKAAVKKSQQKVAVQ